MSGEKPLPKLVQQIKEALRHLENRPAEIRVSVAREAKWEDSSNGDKVLVRWLCWSIEENEYEIVPPTFAVLHDSITEAKLRAELPKFFPGISVVVNEDIEV